jgi:uncharacterized coiled-coil protein SlyX
VHPAKGAKQQGQSLKRGMEEEGGDSTRRQSHVIPPPIWEEPRPPESEGDLGGRVRELEERLAERAREAEGLREALSAREGQVESLQALVTRLQQELQAGGERGEEAEGGAEEERVSANPPSAIGGKGDGLLQDLEELSSGEPPGA